METGGGLDVFISATCGPWCCFSGCRSWSCCGLIHQCSPVETCSRFPVCHGPISQHQCVPPEPEATTEEPWLVCNNSQLAFLSFMSPRKWSHPLLQSMTSLLAQSLQIRRVTTRTHSTSIIRRELFLFDLNFGMVTRHEYGGTRLPTSHAGTFRSASALGFCIGDGRGRRDGHVRATGVIGLRHAGHGAGRTLSVGWGCHCVGLLNGKKSSVVVVAATSRLVVADWRAKGFFYFLLWLWRLSSSRRMGFRGRTGVVLEGRGGHGQRVVLVI